MIQDTANDGLLDVSGVSRKDLLNVGLPASALDRIVAPQHDGGYCQFGSSI
jgi:hypothetical protein